MKKLVCSPITYGLLPTEIQKLILNDSLMPGLTKILMTLRTHPQLLWDPAVSDTSEWNDPSRLIQSAVFVWQSPLHQFGKTVTSEKALYDA